MYIIEVLFRKVIVIFIAMFCFLSIPIISQVTLELPELTFERVGSEQGFSQNSIFHIFQDSLGYMWYSTPNSLFRYDGYDFKVFRNIEEDVESLTSNEVYQVCQDINYKQWILNPHAINCFDPNTEKFKRFPLDEIKRRSFTFFFLNKRYPGHIWLGTNDNLALVEYDLDSYEIKNVTFPIIENDISDEDMAIRFMFQDSNGSIWVVYNYTVAKIDLVDEELEVTVADSIGFISSIVESNDGQLYACIDGDVSTINILDNGSIVSSTLETIIELPDEASPNVYSSLIKLPDGSIWFIYWGWGLVTFNQKMDVTGYYPLFKDPKMFNHGDLSCTYVDFSGMLWIGTFRGGLYKCNLNPKKFFTVGEKQNGKHGLNNRFINQITGDKKSNIWIGSYNGGINKLRVEGNKITIYPEFSDEIGIDMIGNCSGVLYDDKNTVWCSIPEGGVKRIWYNKEDKIKKIEEFNVLDDTKQEIGIIHSFYQDNNKVIWLCSFSGNGLIRVQENDGKTKLVRFEDEVLHEASISGIYRDKDGYLWVGTKDDGIYRYELDQGNKPISKINISEQEKDSKTLTNNYTFSFIEDEIGNLWMSTFGAGLVKLDAGYKNENFIFKYFRKTNGLANDAVYALLMDSDGMLWMSTDEGISYFNPHTETFRNFNVYDGLQNNNFRKWSAWKNDDGIMFFGGTNGFTYFDPKKISFNKLLKTPQITRFEVSQTEIPILNYVYQKSKIESEKRKVLLLKPNENSFSFDFAAMYFDNPKKCRYRYILEGADKNWIETNAEKRYASYSILPHGNYTFKLMASNSDGKWNDDYIAIDIEVLPYWYLTRLAFILYFLTFISIIYLWIQFQKRRRILNTQLETEKIEKRNAIELNKTKLEFFANISHELKSPLTIIAGITEKNLKEQTEQGKSNKDYSVLLTNSKRMLRLISQLLDFRKVDAGHLPVHFVKGDIGNFLHELFDSFSVYAESKNQRFIYEINVSKLEMVFDPDKIEKILSNLISNAFKYSGEDAFVRVSLDVCDVENLPVSILESIDQKKSGYIQITVCDNGIGIPKGQEEKIFDRFYKFKDKSGYANVEEGVGIGLSFSKKLVELHHGHIFAESELNKGSCFKVILPMKQENENIDIDFSNNEVYRVIDNVKNEYNPVVKSTYKPEILRGNKIVFYDHEILIVEDNEEIRNFLKDNLSSKYKIIEAKNGSEGLDIAKERIPDLIISDVRMPIMDGREMCFKIKEDIKTNHIPIILLTANSEIEHRIEGLKAGADSYIPKPFNLEHLQVRIKKLLELRKKIKQKYVSLAGHKPLEEIDVHEDDKKFLKKLEDLIEENLLDSEFSVKDIENQLGFSRMQLYRKVKAITDLSSVEFMRDYRLKRAVDLMHSTNLRVTEIVYSVGFTSASYFGKHFKRKFGKTPSEFLQDVRMS